MIPVLQFSPASSRHILVPKLAIEPLQDRGDSRFAHRFAARFQE
jgi:hypothetical protein